MNHNSENQYFDRHAEDYAERITKIQETFYENSARLLNEWLPFGGTVLDIGNGGVINYDHTRLARLDCGDLVVSEYAKEKYKCFPKIRFFQTDVLDMRHIPPETYDAVIIQCVIHHLAGRTFYDSCVRVSRAVEECMRVLRPDGRLLIVESTVTGQFEQVERMLYPGMQLFFRLCRFGRVYQFSPESLARLLRRIPGTRLTEQKKVEVGPYIWIMGKKIPTGATPCGVSFYVLEKETRETDLRKDIIYDT